MESAQFDANPQMETGVTDISDLVKDWGGFEKLVASLHDTGQVTVEHNVVLLGRSGAPRQIDVLVRHKEGLYEHLIVVECKYWRKNVGRQQVDALAATVSEVGASRGVIFSTSGFQSGAIEQAKHENISLFKVRDITDEEWGKPGKVVHIILQLIRLSAANIAIEVARTWINSGRPEGKPVNLAITLDGSGGQSRTPLIKSSDQKRDTLEELLEDAILKGARKVLAEGFTINGGDECERYMMANLVVNFDKKALLFADGVWIEISGAKMELGLKINQSRIVVDRSMNYLFALAVENYVTSTISIASRVKSTGSTLIEDIQQPDETPNESTVQNGSVLQVFLRDYFDFAELTDKEPVSLDQVRRFRAADASNSGPATNH